MTSSGNKLIITGVSNKWGVMHICRPLIQNKLTVLNKAGLAGDDFSRTDSTLLKVREKSMIVCLVDLL